MLSRKPDLIYLLAFLLLSFIPVQLQAQEALFVKRYAAGEVIPPDVRQRSDTGALFLVKFPAYPGEAVLASLGVVRSPAAVFHIVRKMPADTGLVVWKANENWKASPQLLSRLEKLGRGDSITVFSNATGPGPYRVLRKAAAAVYEVKMSAKDWPLFVALPDVRSADVYRTPRTEVAVPNANPVVNRVTALHADMPLLRGDGMRISLKEQLFDTADMDLRARYLPTDVAAVNVDGHATLMATIIAGSGNSGAWGNGVAPQSRVASSDFARLLPDEASVFATWGLHAQNHSYGTGIENYYGLEGEAYDAQVRDLDTFLHVFSSGNSGAAAPADGIYAGLAGWANLTGNFKQSKNVLVTGATDATGKVAPLSSRGPAYDGRIKPDVVAYGPGGTSDAAALLSGIALLAGEQFRLQNGQAPEAALVAAVLINSADDAGAAGPDFATGFGAVNAREAVRTIVDRRYAMGAISQGGEFTMKITVTAQARELRVTLRYSDLPAEAGSARALVNDLDCRVTDAAGNTFFPLTLSTFPHRDSLLRLAQPGRDSLNNTEQVVVPLPAAGEYTVHVSGHRVKESQRFAIAWRQTQAGAFAWDTPAAGDMLEAAAPGLLRWSTTLSGPGKIYCKAGDEGNWELVWDVQDVSAGYTGWVSPTAFGPVQLRMETGGNLYDTAPFFLAPRLKPATGFICGDSALVWWRPVLGAAGYRVYALESAGYRLLKQVADTVFAFRPSQVLSGVLAVSAYGAMESPRSEAYIFAANDPGCYIRRVNAMMDAQDVVQLRLELGTPVGVRGVRWLKNGLELRVDDDTGNFVYTASDDRPPPGIVQYHAVVLLQDGREVVSEAMPVHVQGPEGYLLFPNPAGAVVRLMTARVQHQHIVISDMQGRVVKTLRLENNLQEISLDGLAAGQYWITIYEKGKRVYGTQLVKVL